MPTAEQRRDYPFLVLEGTDGAGKTSLRKLLFRALARQGREILVMTPYSWRDVDATATIISAKVRDAPLAPALITRAYVRDKEVLSDRIIRVQLPHRPVLCDRFAASDMVYHQTLWNVPPAETYRVFCASRVRLPDYTFFVDTPPQLAFDRLLERGSGGRNRWDYLDKQTRLYETFKEILFGGRFPSLGTVRRIDNSGSREATARAWLAAAYEVLGIAEPPPNAEEMLRL